MVKAYLKRGLKEAWLKFGQGGSPCQDINDVDTDVDINMEIDIDIILYVTVKFRCLFIKVRALTRMCLLSMLFIAEIKVLSRAIRQKQNKTKKPKYYNWKGRQQYLIVYRWYYCLWCTSWWLILCINLIGLSKAQIARKTSFLGASMRESQGEISIWINRLIRSPSPLRKDIILSFDGKKAEEEEFALCLRWDIHLLFLIMGASGSWPFGLELELTR